MLSYLRRWLTPPIFPDEEQTRIASLLNILLLTTSFICLVDAAALLVFAPETIPTFWINGVGVAVGVGLLWIMRRGMVRLASWILCLVMWLLITYYVSISGGLRSPALDFLSLLI